MLHQKLVEHLLRITPHEGEHNTLAPSLKLFRMEQQSMHSQIVYKPALCVVGQGSKVAHVGGDAFSYDPSTFLFATLPTPAEVTITRPESGPFVGLLLEVELEEIIRVMLDLPRQEGQAPVFMSEDEAGKGIFLGSMTEELQDALYRLLLHASEPSRFTVLYPGTLREVYFHLLSGSHGFLLRSLLTQENESLKVIHSARFIEQHFGEALNVGMLATMAGMSESTFYEKFRKVTSHSPMQFVKRIRLYKARTLLVSELGIAQTAFSVGYNSPSQFSRDFRKEYGVSPSQFLSAWQS